MTNSPEQPEAPSTASLLSTDEENFSPLTETINALPSYAARGLLYLVLAVVTLALFGAFVHRIEVVTRVRSSVIPEGKTQLLQASLPGVIQQLYVREGESVQQGQTLLTIDAEEVGQKLAELKKAEQELGLARDYAVDIVPQKVGALQKNLRDEGETFQLRQEIHGLSVQKSYEALKRHELELRNASSSAQLLRKELEVHQRLRTLGLIAEIKLLEVQRAYEEALARIEQMKSLVRDAAQERLLLEKDFAVVRKQHDVLSRDVQEQILTLQRAATERYTLAQSRYEQAHALAHLNLHGVSAELVEQIARGEGHPTNRTVLVAPEDGVIAQLMIRHAGEAVRRGQTLLSLIPRSAPLLAELHIPNKDIGAIRVGQAVRFKFDAFPYAEYGAITGHILRIVPEAQRHEQGDSFYQALASLPQTYFRVETERVPLLAGMTAAAEIVTAQKTLFELLLQPLAGLTSHKEARH